MWKLKDITSERFGRLVAIKRVEKPLSLKPTSSAFWLCRCDCGNETIVRGNSLRSGDTNSCKCLLKEVISATNSTDLTGRRFGKLTAVKPTTTRSKNRNVVWECLCDCGEHTNVPTAHLVDGNTQSCGCTKFIRWRDINFRSLWEVMVAIGLDAREIRWEYEIFSIPVVIDGVNRNYFPDFILPDNGVIVEVKGWHTKMAIGMEKLRQAINSGYRIQVFLLRDVEKIAGCSYSRAKRAFANGGVDALEKLIRSSCEPDRSPKPRLLSVRFDSVF
jgi:hypothetical protein